MMMRMRKKGFLAIEYTVLVAIVVGAFFGIYAYFRRAISGRWRAQVDAFGYGRQYEPSVTTKTRQWH